MIISLLLIEKPIGMPDWYYNIFSRVLKYRGGLVRLCDINLFIGESSAYRNSEIGIDPSLIDENESHFSEIYPKRYLEISNLLLFIFRFNDKMHIFCEYSYEDERFNVLDYTIDDYKEERMIRKGFSEGNIVGNPAFIRIKRILEDALSCSKAFIDHDARALVMLNNSPSMRRRQRLRGR